MNQSKKIKLQSLIIKYHSLNTLLRVIYIRIFLDGENAYDQLKQCIEEMEKLADSLEEFVNDKL